MWKASSTHKRRLRAGHRSRSCNPGTGPALRSRPGGGTPRHARPASRGRRCRIGRGQRSRSLAVGWGPRVRSTIPVSSFGPRLRGSRWCQMCSSTLRTCTPSNLEGSPAAWVRTGLIWAQSVFQVVPSLAGQTLDRGRLTTQLADCPPDRPSAQPPARSADPGVLFQERNHRAGALMTDPAAFAPPDPHRPPGPGRIAVSYTHLTLPTILLV